MNILKKLASIVLKNHEIKSVVYHADEDALYFMAHNKVTGKPAPLGQVSMDFIAENMDEQRGPTQVLLNALNDAFNFVIEEQVSESYCHWTGAQFKFMCKATGMDHSNSIIPEDQEFVVLRSGNKYVVMPEVEFRGTMVVNGVIVPMFIPAPPTPSHVCNITIPDPPKTLQE